MRNASVLRAPDEPVRAAPRSYVSAPLDTPQITYTIDGTAPTTTLTVTPVVKGGSDYQVSWSSLSKLAAGCFNKERYIDKEFLTLVRKAKKMYTHRKKYGG